MRQRKDNYDKNTDHLRALKHGKINEIRRLHLYSHKIRDGYLYFLPRAR